MANVFYDKGREAFATAGVNWTSDTIKASLVDTGTYTFSQSHQYYSSISGVVGTTTALSNKTATNGVLDADDLTFTTVSGSTAEAIVIYKDTGSSATSPLLMYIDTATGLPITPTGGSIVVQWDNGANKIAKL